MIHAGYFVVAGLRAVPARPSLSSLTNHTELSAASLMWGGPWAQPGSFTLNLPADWAHESFALKSPLKHLLRSR